MSKKPKPVSYTPAPTLELKQTRLYEMVLRVLNQQLSVSDAARELGMPRNRFQTWMHRAQAGLIAGITKGQPGRPPEPDREQARRQEQLEQENQRLRAQLERQSELMLAAGQLMREQLQPGRSVRRGQSRSRRPPKVGGSDDDEAPERVDEALARLATGAGAGWSWRRVSAWTGRSESTLRRWRSRQRQGGSAVRQPGVRRGAPLVERSPECARQLEALVVESRGVLGAEALRRASPGVSRREAALLKRATLTRLERDRKAQATRVVITQPGVVRGFDAMHVPDSYALCAGDAAVPYTTSILVRACYDGHSVRLALERDFQENGVPVVLRLDRYAAHSCPEVRRFLEALAVVVLQGPPNHPCFYGQLERQNRERRAWLRTLACPTPTEVASELERCRVLLNTQLVRRSLDWCTAEARWCQRPTLSVDRLALHDEIAERDARFRARLARPHRGVDAGLAYRLAVIDTLKHHGWLRLESRGGRYGISD